MRVHTHTRMSYVFPKMYWNIEYVNSWIQWIHGNKHTHTFEAWNFILAKHFHRNLCHNKSADAQDVTRLHFVWTPFGALNFSRGRLLSQATPNLVLNITTCHSTHVEACTDARLNSDNDVTLVGKTRYCCASFWARWKQLLSYRPPRLWEGSWQSPTCLGIPVKVVCNPAKFCY